MKDAKRDLRDIRLDHSTRLQHAIDASHEGEKLLCEMLRILSELEGHIAKLEDLRVSNIYSEGFVPPRERREAHLNALVMWASCLPETIAQSRTGRERKHVLRAVLEPREDDHVLESYWPLPHH
ncbi:hypothetical protein PMIN06_004406 [Paraphaeosphaeria minitans]